MKKLIAILLILVFVLSLAACGEDKKPTVGGQQTGSNQQTEENNNVPSNQGGQDAPADEGYVEPPVKEPTEPFSPYGTWVWTGNEKFTLTLKEDGSAVLNDQAENSYINLYPRLQVLYMSASNTFTYDETNKRLTIHLKYEDREADMDLKISVGNGYYILEGSQSSYSFVRAEHFEAANYVFLNSPIYSGWENITEIKVGDTIDLDPDKDVELTINSIEMDSQYNVKFNCTISCKGEVTSFNWVAWTLQVKGASGERRDAIYFFDKNNQEINSMKAGQTLECYFTIDSVDDEQSMTWFGELRAGVYIAGMSNGDGAYIILPTKPNC